MTQLFRRAQQLVSERWQQMFLNLHCDLDTVATQDTVTQLRATVRKLLWRRAA